MSDILWTETALRDLEDIGTYIALDSPRSSASVVRRIVETVGLLGFHPRIGRAGRVEATRELVVTGTPYIIVYRLRERIEIITIFHTARRWPDRFS